MRRWPISTSGAGPAARSSRAWISPLSTAQFKKGARFFRLTLDGGLQKKIDRLFQGYFGTLVLLDLPENAIAAAYSKPGFGSAANAAFSEPYEPGSIVKLISLLAYLRQGGDGIFPHGCPGLLAVGGQDLL